MSAIHSTNNLLSVIGKRHLKEMDNLDVNTNPVKKFKIEHLSEEFDQKNGTLVKMEFKEGQMRRLAKVITGVPQYITTSETNESIGIIINNGGCCIIQLFNLEMLPTRTISNLPCSNPVIFGIYSTIILLIGNDGGNSEYKIYKTYTNTSELEWHSFDKSFQEAPTRMIGSGIGFFIGFPNSVYFLAKRSGIEILKISNSNNNSSWLDIAASANQNWLYILDDFEKCIWKYNITKPVPDRIKLEGILLKNPKNLSIIYNDNILHLLMADDNKLIDYYVDKDGLTKTSTINFDTPDYMSVYKQVLFCTLQDTSFYCDEFDKIITSDIDAGFLLFDRKGKLEKLFGQVLNFARQTQGVNEILISYNKPHSSLGKFFEHLFKGQANKSNEFTICYLNFISKISDIIVNANVNEDAQFIKPKFCDELKKTKTNLEQLINNEQQKSNA